MRTTDLNESHYINTIAECEIKYNEIYKMIAEYTHLTEEDCEKLYRIMKETIVRKAQLEHMKHVIKLMTIREHNKNKKQ
jgi:hypothetical protein